MKKKIEIKINESEIKITKIILIFLELNIFVIALFNKNIIPKQIKHNIIVDKLVFIFMNNIFNTGKNKEVVMYLKIFFSLLTTTKNSANNINTNAKVPVEEKPQILVINIRNIIKSFLL